MNENFSTPFSSSSQLASDTANSTPVMAVLPQQEPHHEKRPEEDDPIQQESPLLSVLNVVVDHEMILPTPLEPNEFQQYGNNNIRVPVLRVFGPVLRRDTGYCISPKQSACLYIHGAFPYLLARPVVAGPDGSLLQNQQAASGHTNWDSVESVERILPELQSNLEAAIQASVVTNNPDDSKNDAATPNNNTAPVIRRITVVTGRGFYTYCPGPPAPFLRVEYYDPKLRWKVKLMLERGLTVPSSYHPDPLQYQHSPNTAQDALEPLSFHCYEAHIPYTMQFFKDYNLAGMSYIHLNSGKFRQALPLRVKARVETDDNVNVSEDALFLQSNTPEHCIWNENQVQLSLDSDIAFMQQSSSADESMSSSQPQHVDPFWTRKETSCDLEMDVTVDQILNVKSVMTSLPQDEDERRKIHWRAVPSLREIWRKERQRMTKLLPPKDDFLSQHPSETPFTLNAKDASTPGARLAVEGMHRLMEPSQGLEQQFRRAMKQIIDRHSSSVSEVDEALGNHTVEKAPRVPSFLTPTENAGSSQLTPSVSSPPMDDAMDALGALASQFGETEENDESSNQDIDDTLNSLLSQVAADGNGLNANDFLVGSSFTQQPQNSQLSQASSSASPYQLLSQQCTQDPFEFSQRVERGDSTAEDPVAHVEELINPDTLTPYDDPEDVDDGFLEEEEAMSEREFENSLSMLATQAQSFAREKSVLLQHEADESQKEGLSQPWVHGDITQPQHVNRGDSQSDSDNSIGYEANIADASGLHDAGQSSGTPQSVASAQSATTAPTEFSHNLSPPTPVQLIPIEGDVYLEMKKSAPTRFEISNRAGISASLHPLGGFRGVPKWLRHSAEYGNIRRDLVSSGNLVHNWSIPTDHSIEIEPVSKAPTRGKVKAWQKKKRKRANDESAQRRKMTKNTEGKSKAVQAKSSSWTNTNLQIDGNSLMLMAKQQPQSEQVGFLSANASGAAQQVEEVEWEPTMSPPEADDPNEPGRETSSGLENVDLTPSSHGVATDTSETRNESGQTYSSSTPQSFSETTSNALDGIGQQGGRIYVEGGGGLKAKARSPLRGASREHGETSNLYGSDLPSPLTMMSIEVHVQCRIGRAGVNDSKEIAMRPNPEKDKIFAVAYIYACDPGGGEVLKVFERGCLYVPNEDDQITENGHDAGEKMASSIPGTTMGMPSKLTIQPVRDEKHLLLRLASIVHWKDPDMLISWDTQGSGLGYIIERGSFISNGHSDGEMLSSSSQAASEIDMVRLLGRSPRAKKSDEESNQSTSYNQNNRMDVLNETKEESGKKSRADKWKGSGLGAEWDDRVGAGAAASSIKGRLVFSGWKIAAEDVKHPNASYLPAIVSTVLDKRIPFHDDLQLTRWYGCDAGRERWRVLHYRLTQATACLLILDALDVCGRATEAAGLSGVEFSQSFPGIRGSQYKVEGVLLRALQSINAEERGAKSGHRRVALSDDGKTMMGIDQPGSQSSESKSQTQSPWKVRRRSVYNDNSEAVDVSDANYFFFSPSVQDCSRQEALECQALTLEPQSGHYDDPVVVCDFTALYPSLMIAYNLCYSTCAGKLDYHSTRQEMRQEGKMTGRVGPMRYPEARTATVLKHHMKSLIAAGCGTDEGNGKASQNDRAYPAPTGTIFVSEAALRGVLPQVLDEMLKTRAMLKKAAKQYKKLVPDLAPSVLRQLEARQLAIKMIANVTYGYTSATFSGRSAMPLVADSIVECGRRTLSNAINLANSWGRDANGIWHGAAEVVYGDTDSIFIRMRGRSVQEAFEFGEAFCKAVTASNPPPVHLKLEKVYQGSIMQTKKKYCGMKYESPDQKKPDFEAKGIETIRRDQCALTQKVLRNALITLFQSGIRAVKSYLFRQWSLILSGRLPVSEFILTGRVRSRYRGGKVGPVQAVLARRLAEADPGRVIRHKERLAYVIVATPGLTFRLKDCVLTPTELLEQWDAYSIHTTYYITKHVNAALQRCLGLAPHNVDVNAWFASCPKPRRRIHFWPVTRSGSNIMISSYFGSDICALCGSKCRANGNSRAVVCNDCQRDEIEAAQLALSRLNKVQADAKKLAAVCSACNLCFEDSSTFAPIKSGQAGIGTNALSVAARGNPGIMTPIANCTCIDCPNTFERHGLREAELEAVAVCQALQLM